jgi:uncharacterized protein YaiE (UPF0345 family)
MMNNRRRWIAAVAAALVSAVIGVTAVLATSSSATAAKALPAASAAGGFGSSGSNARSAPSAGGTVGTVGIMSTAGFTVSTSAGQEVTIVAAAATTYQKGMSTASASAVTPGEPVLVLGTTNGMTITATQVIVQPAGGASSAAAVVPFQRGAPATSKSVGQIPAGYSQGSGTIVSGSAADKATQASLAAYPGGVVDRVVQLSTGEYEVHNIGINWPHHVFVNQDFQVIGAN